MTSLSNWAQWANMAENTENAKSVKLSDKIHVIRGLELHSDYVNASTNPHLKIWINLLCMKWFTALRHKTIIYLPFPNIYLDYFSADLICAIVEIMWRNKFKDLHNLLWFSVRFLIFMVSGFLHICKLNWKSNSWKLASGNICCLN